MSAATSAAIPGAPAPVADPKGWEAVHETPAADRVPLRTKIGYGAGGISEFLYLTLPNSMSLPIYAKTFGMDTRVLGFASAIPRLTGAIAATLMGGISDNTRSRWGRRRPYILLGAAAGAVMLPFMWYPPVKYGQSAMFAYISGLISIYSILYTIFFVPYQALGFELTTDYDERTRVQAWKGYMSGLGFFLAPWFFWFCTRPMFPDLLTGVRWLSAFIGVVIFGGALMTVGCCRESTQSQRQPKIGIMPAIKLTLRNKPFLLLQGAANLMTLGVCCCGTVGFYLNMEYVCRGDEKLFGLLGGVNGTISNLMTYVGTALGVWVSLHLGKKRTSMLGMLLIIIGIGLVGIFLAPEYSWLPWLPKKHHLWLTIVPGVVINLGLQNCNLMFASMTADICDEDELSTGLRREGAYVAVMGLIHKINQILMGVIAGFMPFLAGYTNMTMKPTLEQLLRMKWVLVGIQGGFCILALLVLILYPITREMSEQTRRKLAARRAAAVAVNA